MLARSEAEIRKLRIICPDGPQVLRARISPMFAVYSEGKLVSTWNGAGLKLACLPALSPHVYRLLGSQGRQPQDGGEHVSAERSARMLKHTAVLHLVPGANNQRFMDKMEEFLPSARRLIKDPCTGVDEQLSDPPAFRSDRRCKKEREAAVAADATLAPAVPSR